MWKKGLTLVALIVALTTMSFDGNAFASVWYVDNSALPGGTGTNWQNAFNTVQAGIGAAAFGDEVWVKQGIYYENIAMKDGVAIYGGFSDNMSAREQRNWTQYSTVLDGKTSGSVINMGYCCPSPNTRVDGFTIQNGYSGNGGGYFYLSIVWRNNQ